MNIETINKFIRPGKPIGGFLSEERTVNVIMNTDNRQFIKFKPKWRRDAEEVVKTVAGVILIGAGMVGMLHLAAGQIK